MSARKIGQKRSGRGEKFNKAKGPRSSSRGEESRLTGRRICLRGGVFSGGFRTRRGKKERACRRDLHHREMPVQGDVCSFTIKKRDSGVFLKRTWDRKKNGNLPVPNLVLVWDVRPAKLRQPPPHRHQPQKSH